MIKVAREVNISQTVLLAVLFFIFSPVDAQQSGNHQNLLQTAITATMEGNCPENLMTPLLRGVCEDQQPAMGQRIKQLGDINGLEFMGTQGSQMGPAEVYRVHHEYGSMIWMINTDSQGKIVVLWTPG